MEAVRKLTDTREIDTARKKISGLFSQAADCWLKVIAMITVDPAITYRWLKQNPDKYSSEDIVDAYLGYKEARSQQIADRVKRAASFRNNLAGEGVHPDAPLAGNKRPA
jgi:hypothetical protein